MALQLQGTANATVLTATDIVRCCMFEVVVKGVLFDKGYLKLNPAEFQRVTFTRDYKNNHHARAYWVKLANGSIKLGHLSRDTAETWYYVSRIPTVK